MLAFHCELTTASATEQNVLVFFPPCGHFQVEDWPWPAPAAAPKAAGMSLYLGFGPGDVGRSHGAPSSFTSSTALGNV